MENLIDLKTVWIGGEVWHQSCFVCAQCFRPFSKDAIFYEFEGRKYCEHDFHVLFAPCCGKCGEFVIGIPLESLIFSQLIIIWTKGRVIKALNNNWHPMCFRCELCQTTLADQGFIKNAGISTKKSLEYIWFNLISVWQVVHFATSVTPKRKRRRSANISALNATPSSMREHLSNIKSDIFINSKLI